MLSKIIFTTSCTSLSLPDWIPRRALFIAVFLSNIFPACRFWQVTFISHGFNNPLDSFVTHAINGSSICTGSHTACRLHICFYMQASRTLDCTDSDIISETCKIHSLTFPSNYFNTLDWISQCLSHRPFISVFAE